MKRVPAFRTMHIRPFCKAHVPLPPMVVNALREWRLAQPRSDSDLVFPGERDQHLALGTIVRYVWHPTQTAARIVTKAGRRSTTASCATRRGASIAALTAAWSCRSKWQAVP